MGFRRSQTLEILNGKSALLDPSVLTLRRMQTGEHHFHVAGFSLNQNLRKLDVVPVIDEFPRLTRRDLESFGNRPNQVEAA